MNQSCIENSTKTAKTVNWLYLFFQEYNKRVRGAIAVRDYDKNVD